MIFINRCLRSVNSIFISLWSLFPVLFDINLGNISLSQLILHTVNVIQPQATNGEESEIFSVHILISLMLRI